jgi:hypothetical protein
MSALAAIPASTSCARKPAGSAELWAAVERIVERRLHATDLLSAHGLGPLAADLLERRGRSLPLPLLQEQRAVRLAAVTAPALVARIRQSLDGPLLLLKGPEVAARYPQQARGFGDIDVLVPDADAAQRALLAAGFVEEDDPEGLWVGIHHLARISSPGLPLTVEVHSQPKWPEGLDPPPPEQLFEAAVPALVGVPGVFAPAPAHHALLLAAHSWAHQPLGRARDLVDVGAVATEVDPSELARLAREWRVARLWSTVDAALDAFLARRRSLPLRLWARHVPELRMQTVLEQHLERLLSPYWGLPLAAAFPESARALRNEFLPAFDENWPEKTRRSAAALRRAFMPVTRHETLLGDSATRGRGRNKPPGAPS